MLRWFLLGQNPDKALTTAFADSLASQFAVTAFCGSRAFMKGQGENMLLSSLPLLYRCPTEGALGILLPQGGVPLCVPKNIPLLVSSENEQQLRHLAEHNLCGYSCGLSGKDTFTFSSRSETSACVALMREVKDVFGKTVEPMELPIELPAPANDFALLAYGAARILSGLVSERALAFLPK